MTDRTAKIIHVLFLCLSSDSRQIAKRLLDDDEIQALARFLDCPVEEINW